MRRRRLGSASTPSEWRLGFSYPDVYPLKVETFSAHSMTGKLRRTELLFAWRRSIIWQLGSWVREREMSERLERKTERSERKREKGRDFFVFNFLFF